MAKRTLPEIREAVKAITSDLRLTLYADDPTRAKTLLMLDDIDTAMDETRRADFGKPKPKAKKPIVIHPDEPETIP